VVDNLQEGLQAVQLLSDNKKGKANFFLLDQLKEVSNQPAHQVEHAIPALDVIEIDNRYNDLAKYLLGNVVIAENEEALQNSNGAVVLEKHGKYVKGKYSLSGGSVGLFEGKKIGRAKNLEKLSAEIAKQEKVVNDIKEIIATRSKEVMAYNEQLKEKSINTVQQSINQLTNTVFSIQNKIENIQHSDETSRKRLEDLQKQLQGTQDESHTTRELLKNLTHDMEAFNKSLEIIEEDYRNAETDFNSVNATFNEKNLNTARQHSKVAALKQELTFKTNQLNDLTTQVDNSINQLSDSTGAIATTVGELEKLNEELIGLLKNREAEEKKLNEADQAYYNARNILNDRESELRHKQKNKEQTDQLLNEIKDRLNELKVQLAGMKERLHVEFRVNLDDILEEERTTTTPLEELQEKNDRMKKRLENIGEINPTAIEAYTEMKKRYEFIVEQKNDLVSAKDSLMQTIQEVEATANQQFLDTFNKVRENFQKVFKALFTEDDMADMVLENPDDLSETGVEIVARPKGKKPTSISQLSGGEKTLTATALLFAIYLIKPAPFCILDEVDAPLDDANVGKFTQMIRQFSKESQFIIVTHNKMTMSTVDVIYGVTMQEAGVSKLVPVDFRGLN
jgi:chromosome segregation protein